MQQQSRRSELEAETRKLREQLASLQRLFLEQPITPAVETQARPLVAAEYQLHRSLEGQFSYLSVDGQCRDLFGVEPADLVGNDLIIRTMIDSDDIQGWKRRLEESAQSLTPFYCEYRIRNARGQQFTLRDLACPTRSDDGSIVWHGMVSNGTDRSEEKVQQLSALVDASHAVSVSPSKEELLAETALHARRLTASHQAWVILSVQNTWVTGGESSSDKYPSSPESILEIDSSAVMERLSHSDKASFVGMAVPGIDVRKAATARDEKSCQDELLAVSLLSRSGGLLGAIVVADPMQANYTEEDRHYLQRLARFVALELELWQIESMFGIDQASRSHADSFSARERMLRRLLKLQERDRRQVSHDIHDGFVQYIVAAQMSLEALHGKLRRQNQRVPDELSQLRELIDRGLAEARRLIDELRPTLIDQGGIVEAVEYLISEEERRGLRVSLRCASDIGRLDPMLEQAALRIIQESLANVRRHAQVDRAQIRLSKCDERLRILVRDNGLGFAVGNYPHECFGLRGINERAKLFSGQARVLSRPGHGTVVDVEIPVACNLFDA